MSYPLPSIVIIEGDSGHLRDGRKARCSQHPSPLQSLPRIKDPCLLGLAGILTAALADIKRLHGP